MSYSFSIYNSTVSFNLSVCYDDGKLLLSLSVLWYSGRTYILVIK